MSNTLFIERSVDVQGTVEEAWRAIATGPGISSWYVPHDIEEQEGGAASASFGPGMDVAGKVAVWEPPHRVKFTSPDGEGLTFEWFVTKKDETTSTIRLVNDGFPADENATAYRDAMDEGWQTFFYNLTLHMKHFRGQTAAAMLPLATWEGPRSNAWERLKNQLGINANYAVGDRLKVTPKEDLLLEGTIVDIQTYRLTLLVDQPAPGTAFIAAEGNGDQISVSVWAYLYGPEKQELVETTDPQWRTLLTEPTESN